MKKISQDWGKKTVLKNEPVLPEIRSYKPKADKGVKTDIVFKWSKTALEAKQSLQDQKISKPIIYNSKDGVSKTFNIKSYPKLKDLTFKKPEVKEYILPSREDRKKAKEEAINKLTFSKLHHKLVAGLYINPFSAERRMKQRAEQNAHNLKIEKLAEELRNRKLSRYKYRLETICDTVDKGLHRAFVNYSSQKENVLIDSITRLAKKYAKSLTNFSHMKLVDNITSKLIHVSTGGVDEDKENMLNKLKLDRLHLEYPDYYADKAA